MFVLGTEASLINLSTPRDHTSTKDRENTHKKKTLEFYVVRPSNSGILHGALMQERSAIGGKIQSLRERTSHLSNLSLSLSFHSHISLSFSYNERITSQTISYISRGSYIVLKNVNTIHHLMIAHTTKVIRSNDPSLIWTSIV